MNSTPSHNSSSRLQIHFFFFHLPGSSIGFESLASEVHSCWEFHKTKFPREFQQRYSRSQNPLSSLAQLKSPATEATPTHGAPHSSRFSSLVLTEAPVCCWEPLGVCVGVSVQTSSAFSSPGSYLLKMFLHDLGI